MSVLRRAIRGLHARLLLAHLLVIAVGLVTVYAAASVAAPRFFERNMLAQARRTAPPPQNAVARPSQGGQPARPQIPGPGRLGIMSAELEQRVTEIYLASLTDSLLLAGGAALATAIVASVLVSRG